MKKRVLSLLLAGVMVFSIVGCGPQKKQTEGTSSPKAETDAGGSGKDGITISLWKWIPTDGVQLDAILEAWEKDHPEIHLDITHVGEAGDVFQKYSAALPAGEGPTVLAMQVGARANQFKEFCEPLAPYAEEKWGADWESLFLDTALEQCRWSGDDYTVLPGGMTAAPAIEYNVNAFKKLGITKVPETMDEVYDIIEKSKADGQMIPGVAIGAKEGWTCRDIYMSIMNQLAPGKIYDAIEGKTSFTDPEFVEGMNIWKEMFDKGFFAEGSLGTALYPEINDNMMMGGTDGKKYYIMENCGTWHGSSMTKTTIEGEAANGNCDPDTHLGAFPLPPVKEGCKPNMVATVDIAWGINKNATEEEKKAAFEFVSWMAEGKGHEVFSNTLQVLPAAKDISLEEGIASLNGEDEKEAVKMFQDYVENNSGAREIQYPDVSNALDDALVSVASGIMTPEEALETVQTASAGMSR
ncbi:ABC transporter substrate-binding protein [Novisyntrophococcus fermenticellae]|uniref:ABC transporter substrate-binding protein n=1 Tax=Novisyntrophococcus fermenticellae TaxID=2068655 RepID=UPI001E4E84F7|nr:ABC transporter substrate-binding protein [Novisyntrophococcus fermenticellae]